MRTKTKNNLNQYIDIREHRLKIFGEYSLLQTPFHLLTLFNRAQTRRICEHDRARIRGCDGCELSLSVILRFVGKKVNVEFTFLGTIAR